MNTDSLVYNYLKQNPFNQCYKFVDGLNVPIICLNLGIDETIFYQSLQNLVLSKTLQKKLLHEIEIKQISLETNMIYNISKSKVYGYI